MRISLDSPPGRTVVRRSWLAVRYGLRLRRPCVPRRSQSERAGERGSGTLNAVALIAVLLVCVCATTTLVGAQAAAGRARLAADLAALAGATAHTSVIAGRDPCDLAGDVAVANGAHLDQCRLEGDDVLVEVSVPAHLPGLNRVARAVARAGPVTTPASE